MTEDATRDKYIEVQGQHRLAKQEINALGHLGVVLMDSYNKRKSVYYHFRTEISVKAKSTFNYLLNARGYRGKLDFDHKKEEIRVKVNPQGATSGTRKDPKSLSGGEKSFAQICMLLSVWEAMGSPVRALDELCVPCPGSANLVMYSWML
jgi:structural maintenance of chromosomes protein 6